MSAKDFISSILKGKCIIPDVFHTFGDELIQSKGIQDQLCFAKSELEKLKIFDTVFPEEKFRELLDRICSGLEKNDDYTDLLKREADKSLKKSDFPKALHAYNLAAAFAPEKSEYGGRLYAGRAKTLIALERKAECLTDIKTARTFLLNKELEGKLFGIEFKCLLMTPDDDHDDDEYKDQKEKYQAYCKDVIFTIPGDPNEAIQCGSDCIEIVCNEEKGRHVVLTEDMEPGVTVVVEDPYLMLLNDICKWDFKHCSHCLKRIHASVHCRKCVFMSYCDEKCREADYLNGHRYECACMIFMHSIRLVPFIHFCFKILCKAGPRELYGIYKKDKKAPKEYPTVKMGVPGFDPKTGLYHSTAYCPLNGTYKSDSYFQIQHLVFHENFEGAEGSYLPWVSIILIRALDHRTSFFRGIRDKYKSDFMIFVASKLLHHCHSIPYNGFAVYDESEIYEPTREEKFFGYERPGIGNSIYSLSSLLNHSCDPTVTRVSLPNGKMAMITNRKMKAGDELTTTYGLTFFNHGLAIRQHEMKKDYLFICNCPACTFNWPSYQTMTAFVDFICPDCCGSFDHTDTDEAERHMLSPFDLEDTCPTCGKEFEIGDLLYEAGHYLDKYTLAKDLVDDGQEIAAIPIVIECIGYYQTKMLIPNINLISSQMLLKKCYEDIIDGST